MEFLVTKTKGFAVTYLTREPDDPDVLEDEIDKLRARGVRVKALMAVPKFWIYLLKELLEELKGKPVLRDLGEKILAIEKNGHLQNLGMIDKAKLTATRLLLRDKLGGHFSYGISSSSKLDPALVEIFGKLGITVLDIYGATECTGIIARSRLNEIHPGTSGTHPPGPGVAAGSATLAARVGRTGGSARGQGPDRCRRLPRRGWRDRTSGPHGGRLASHWRPCLGG